MPHIDTVPRAVILGGEFTGTHTAAGRCKPFPTTGLKGGRKTTAAFYQQFASPAPRGETLVM
jgi:hypothetical protein